MADVKVGAKVEGNWGAGIATSEGEVDSIENDLVVIRWDTDSELRYAPYYQTVSLSGINKTSANGSPIGIFTA